MAEWFRPLIFSTLNHSPSHCCGSRETSQVLLAGVFSFYFSGDLPFSPHLATDSAQNE